MATRRKPPAKKVKFELTYSGIAGIGTVLFCIFLWMFLFGVWTGQTLLLPPSVDLPGVAERADFESGSPAIDPLHIEPVQAKRIR